MVPCRGASATPKLPLTSTSMPLSSTGASRAACRRRPSRSAPSASPQPSASTANSSPPSRATNARGVSAAARRSATSASSRSPWAWPRVSLTSLKASRSRMPTANPANPSVSALSSRVSISRCSRARLGRPVRGSCSSSCRNFSTSSPLRSATAAWLATVSSTRTSSGSKPRASPSRSSTASRPITPPSPRSGTMMVSRSRFRSSQARCRGSRVPRGTSTGRPSPTTPAAGSSASETASAGPCRSRSEPSRTTSTPSAPPSGTKTTRARSACRISRACWRTPCSTPSTPGARNATWLNR